MDMNREIIFFRGGGEREWMPLEIRNTGTGEKNILASSSGGLFFLDVDLDDI